METRTTYSGQATAYSLESHTFSVPSSASTSFSSRCSLDTLMALPPSSTQTLAAHPWHGLLIFCSICFGGQTTFSLVRPESLPSFFFLGYSPSTLGYHIKFPLSYNCFLIKDNNSDIKLPLLNLPCGFFLFIGPRQLTGVMESQWEH